jgi:hypothetical protein
VCDAPPAHRELRRRFEFRLISEQRRRGIFDKPAQLRSRQAPVQRLQDRARAHAGKMQDEDVDAVARQDRDAFARCRTEQALEPASASGDPQVELAIGETFAACEIDTSQPIAVCDRMAGDEIRVIDDSAASGFGFNAPGQRGHDIFSVPNGAFCHA